MLRLCTAVGSPCSEEAELNRVGTPNDKEPGWTIENNAEHKGAISEMLNKKCHKKVGYVNWSEVDQVYGRLCATIGSAPCQYPKQALWRSSSSR